MAKDRKVSKKQDCVHSEHPDHSQSLPRLRRAQGQLDGIAAMIGGRRYCPEILDQIKAVYSALRSLEGEIFERHLEHCIKNAMHSKSETEIDKKVKELIKFYKK